MNAVQESLGKTLDVIIVQVAGTKQMQRVWISPNVSLFFIVVAVQTIRNKNIGSLTLVDLFAVSGLRCNKGETSEPGSKSCRSCGLGLYGHSPGNCSVCQIGQYQDGKGNTDFTDCKTCEEGQIPNDDQTACQTMPWAVAADCDIKTQYLNNRNPDKMLHRCVPCPRGASCFGNVVWTDVVALKGWWRVPWSENNSTFKRCPYPDDCLGVPSVLSVVTNATEGCTPTTTGPLCSICIENHNRDVGQCNMCDDSSVPVRVGILLGFLAALIVLIATCRRQIQRKWSKYRPLWRDFLRILSINITFAQINSSLPSVLDIQ